MNELTINESERRTHLESIIERNIKGFVEIGAALAEIRDSRLYKNDYSTFEDYCKDRWNISRSHSYRLMEAAEVANDINVPHGVQITERQIRPLTLIESEHQQEIWAKAVETAPNGKVTAAHVQQVIDNTIMEPTTKAAKHKQDLQNQLKNQQKLTKQLSREKELKEIANNINANYTKEERNFFIHLIKL